VWPPAAATDASSLYQNDSDSNIMQYWSQYHDFLGKEPVAGNHEILSEDHVDCGASFSERNTQIIFSCAATQFLVTDKCSSSIARHVESNRHCRWMTRKFFIVVLKTSATYISFCCFHLISDRNHNVNNMAQDASSPLMSSRMSSRMHERHSTWLTKCSRS